MQRKDEILAKKARLAELKRQRELKAQDISASRQRAATPSDAASTTPSRTENRRDLDNLISSLVGEDKGGSPTPGTPSPLRHRGRQSTAHASIEQPGTADQSPKPQNQAAQASVSGPQNLSFAPFRTIYEITSGPAKRTVETYSKGVQAGEPYTRTPPSSDNEESSRTSSQRGERPPARRLSRRQREQREEELRANLRREVEEELKAVQGSSQEINGAVTSDAAQKQQPNFPARGLSTEEYEAVTSSNDFLDFIERSSKVIERALDEEYDVLADYTHGSLGGLDDDDDEIGGKGRKGRRIKEIIQFWDEKNSKRRMVSDVGFSPKFPELLLSSHTKNPSSPYSPSGLINLWNLHLHSRPELTLTASSDILTARFSPFHPNLILGGTYSGQVLLWDTRNRTAEPSLKSPLTGQGHTHPIYGLQVVGSQNAHSVVSCSTDGVVCSWAMDMLGIPQEYLELTAPASLPPLQPQQPSSSTTTTSTLPFTSSRPTDDLAPTCISFPSADPTYLLAGSESGTIHLVHRYDRAGARAGADARISYRGHAGPVMGLAFHGSEGPVDLGDLALSCGVDWTIKLWRVRNPASTSAATAAAAAAATNSNGTNKPPGTTKTSLTNTGTGSASAPDDAKVDIISPLLDLAREDSVYDIKWSPVKPGVFASVDGSGGLEIWDLAREAEVPIARGVPGQRRATSSSGSGSGAGGLATSGLNGAAMGSSTGSALNRCAWEPHEGRKVAVGGIDGMVSVWEVGGELGGAESAQQDEWARLRRLVNRLEGKRA